MSATTRKDLLNRLLDGNLDDLLLEVLHGERSFFALSAELIAEHNITVSPETLRRWAVALEPAEDGAA